VNIFGEAKQILDRKDAGKEVTWEEMQKVHEACLALDFFADFPIKEGLEHLSRMVEGLPEPTKSKSTGLERQTKGIRPTKSDTKLTREAIYDSNR
jgi:hypothetical protein